MNQMPIIIARATGLAYIVIVPESKGQVNQLIYYQM